MEFAELGHQSLAKIKVVGVGGGGGNAVNNMVQSQLSGVTFITANTDMQALNFSLAETKVQLGQKLTKGLGAGANPKVGCDAALESVAQLKEAIGEAEMVFVTAGMGGGTGTGAAPVIAQVAKEMGALTVGVVTKPFTFEGRRRMMTAEAGIEELRKSVDSLITIPNSRLVQLAPKNATFKDMLKRADDVLFHAVKGISDLLMVPGLINLDFADVTAVMGESGLALMGTGVSTGESRAREAAMHAITSPLLEDVSIDGARGVLINITSGPDITIEEVTEASTIIQEAAHQDANIFFGAVFDDNCGEELRITVIATGIDNVAAPAEQPAAKNSNNFPGPRGGGRPASPVEALAAARAAQSQPQTGTRSGGFNGNYPTQGTRRVEDPSIGLGIKPVQSLGHHPGEEDFIFDEDEMEIPSFIRKQAN